MLAGNLWFQRTRAAEDADGMWRVAVVGYGNGDGESEEERKRRKMGLSKKKRGSPLMLLLYPLAPS